MKALTRYLVHVVAAIAFFHVSGVLAEALVGVLPVGFEYAFYDAAAPEVPKDYPAKHYTADVLLRRFVEISQGPELSREEFEREFGIRFVKLFERGEYRGVARGQFPLGNELSRYSDYRMGKSSGRVFVSLDLRNRTVGTGGGPLGGNEPGVCVRGMDFHKALGTSWKVTSQGTNSHYPRNVSFLKAIDGRIREVRPSPPADSSAIDCIHSLDLIYDSDPDVDLQSSGSPAWVR